MKEYGEWIKDKFRDEDLVREYLIEAEELSRQNNDPSYLMEAMKNAVLFTCSLEKNRRV